MSRKQAVSVSMQDDDILIVQNNPLQQPETMPITAWLYFAVYSTVLCRSDPLQCVGLFHYMEHIRKLKDLGYDWMKYDISYRKLHADNPTLYPFSQDLIQLQMEYSPPLVSKSFNNYGNQTNKPKPFSASSRTPFNPQNQAM